MNNKIHQTAIIDSSAELGNGVVIGPYTIVHPNVSIGDNAVIKSHAVVESYTRIGNNCKVFTGAVIGSIPQDLKFAGEKSELIIEDGTVIREYVTINRGTKNGGGITRIGKNVLLMAYAHVAHDSIVEDNAILANAVTLAGHVHIQKNAIIGGLTPIHQFVNIGEYSFIGGASRVSKDVLPYTRAAGSPLEIIGLNVVGLQRNNFSPDTINVMKIVYRIIFRENLNTSQAVDRIKQEIDTSIPEIKKIIKFIENSRRGISK